MEKFLIKIDNNFGLNVVYNVYLVVTGRSCTQF